MTWSKNCNTLKNKPSITLVIRNTANSISLANGYLGFFSLTPSCVSPGQAAAKCKEFQRQIDAAYKNAPPRYRRGAVLAIVRRAKPYKCTLNTYGF